MTENIGEMGIPRNAGISLFIKQEESYVLC